MLRSERRHHHFAIQSPGCPNEPRMGHQTGVPVAHERRRCTTDDRRAPSNPNMCECTIVLSCRTLTMIACDVRNVRRACCRIGRIFWECMCSSVRVCNLFSGKTRSSRLCAKLIAYTRTSMQSQRRLAYSH